METVDLSLVMVGIAETLQEIALSNEKFARLMAHVDAQPKGSPNAFRDLAEAVERIEAIANGQVS